MAVQFDISALAETLAEGGTYTFTLTPTGTLSGAVDIRWVIVPKGKVPITDNDFSAFTGTARFASGATASDVQTITITPTDDSKPEVSGEFEIQVYEVVTGGGDDDDLLIGSQDVTLTDDADTGAGIFNRLPGNSKANSFFLGHSDPLKPTGGNGNDVYVISRYQSGNIKLDDKFDLNTIKFDYGVEIVSAVRTGFLGSGDAELTLGTGGVVTWATPHVGITWQYQIGDGAVLSWDDFLTALGPTTGTALTTPFTVDSLATDTVAGGNIASRLSGGSLDDILSVGGDGYFKSAGGNGDDIYVISRYQSGNIKLDDKFGTNIIKFDFDVEIVSVVRTGFLGSGDAELTLGTGGVVTWATPHVGITWQYQIADGAVLSWDDFLTALGPTTGTALTTPFTVPGPPSDTPSAPEGVPDTGLHYFKWDAAKTGFGRFLVSDDSAADVSETEPADVGGNDLVLLGAGVPSGRTIDFGAGTDVYVIQSGLNVAITINDQIHGAASAATQNLVRFDEDLLTGEYVATTVPILTGQANTKVEIKGTGSESANKFDITLQGAAQNYVYQIGDDGDVMTYAEFITALDLI